MCSSFVRATRNESLSHRHIALKLHIHQLRLQIFHLVFCTPLSHPWHAESRNHSAYFGSCCLQSSKCRLRNIVCTHMIAHSLPSAACSCERLRVHKHTTSDAHIQTHTMPQSRTQALKTRTFQHCDGAAGFTPQANLNNSNNSNYVQSTRLSGVF